MKIKTNDVSKVVVEQARKISGHKEASKFAKILQHTVSSGDTQAGTQVQKSTTVAQIKEIQATQHVEEQLSPIIERVEDLIDTLDEYQKSLGSSDIPSHALKPIINRMEDHNKALAAVLISLPDGDSLKDILNHVLITSVVEVEKFNRGDYS